MKTQFSLDPYILLTEVTRLATAVVSTASALIRLVRGQRAKALDKMKGEITMKKSTLVALLVFLSAVAGALAAGYCYLLKREKELDEYEQMLFSEDYEEDDAAAPAMDDAEQPDEEA